METAISKTDAGKLNKVTHLYIVLPIWRVDVKTLKIFYFQFQFSKKNENVSELLLHETYDAFLQMDPQIFPAC